MYLRKKKKKRKKDEKKKKKKKKKEKKKKRGGGRKEEDSSADNDLSCPSREPSEVERRREKLQPKSEKGALKKKRCTAKTRLTALKRLSS